METGVAQLRTFLVNFRHGSVTYDMTPYLYVLREAEASAHLLRVATGLDSRLIGEAEILGQVREAYQRAHTSGCFGPVLHRLFREALNAGKEARSRTHICGNSVSIATAAVAFAREHLGSLREASVLLVGAGQMGVKAAKRFKIEGTRSLAIANRTVARAEELVQALGMGVAVALDGIDDALEHADVVLTSIVAPSFVVDRAMVEAAMRKRAGRPICFVDIAVPRNVAPDVATLEHVSVVDIDQLGVPVELALDHRRDAIPMVEAIITEHHERFEGWYAGRQSVPLLSALNKRAETIRSEELDRVMARCPALSERERAIVTSMGLRIISKLMHPTFTSIRDAGSLHADLIDELFALGLHDRPATQE